MMDDARLSCTFCGKSQDDVVAILAFPDNLSICDECVTLMVDAIAEGHPEWRDKLVEKLKNPAAQL